MMSEIVLGRRGRHSPAQTMRLLAKEDKRSPNWQVIGWFGMLAGVMILSFYVVIAGWTAAYLWESFFDSFRGITQVQAEVMFNDLIGNPWRLLGWHTVMVLLVGWIIMRGVNKGIEQATTVLIPSLFVILLLLLSYAALYGEFAQGLNYLFAFDATRVSPEVVLKAMGQAFFSLSIGMGAIMVYGAYLPRKFSIPQAASVVVAADALVAILMGVALFPIVFASGLEPGAGPGLMFQTLVIAFGQMPGGWLMGILFFALTLIAAWTSAISLLEPTVSWLVDSRGMRRKQATWSCAALIWVLGLGTVVSFNVASDWTLLGRTFFDWMDYVTSNFMLPIGGILISIYIGWMVSRQTLLEKSDLSEGVLFGSWLWLVRVFVPLAIFLVLLHGVGLISPAASWLRELGSRVLRVLLHGVGLI